MSMKTSVLLGLMGAAMLLGSPTAEADNWADKTMVNGFLSSRYSLTDDPLLFHGARGENGINEDGSFHGTKLGLNIRTQVSDHLRVASQLFSSIEDDSYATKVDWAFARFTISDEWAVRAGKIKYPVGLVNEYVDVGLTYPWIEAPVLVYSESASGPQATREAYTGASAQWQRNLGDWSLGTDIFLGQVDLTDMTIKKLRGITARAEWNNVVALQASTYVGEMNPDDPTTMMGMMMEDKEHSATLFGAKADWNNVVAYAEWADVSMDVKNMMGVAINDSKSWYTTLGYRLGDRWLPHYTYQNWERDNGDGHEISTLGLVYTISPNAVLKLEQSVIKTDSTGLFVNNIGVPTSPSGDVNMTSIAIDVVF